MTLDFKNIKDEQINFIRKSVTDPKSRTTNTTQNFTGDAIEDTFTLTNGITSSSFLQHVNSVTVAGVAQVWGTDFEAEFVGANKNKIIFVTAPADGAAIVVDYNHGANDICYPGFPRKDLNISSYPRIGVLVSHTTELISASNYVTQTEMRMRCIIMGENTAEIDVLMKEIRDAYLASPKFFYLRFVTPLSATDMVLNENRSGAVVGKILELRAPFNLEKN